MRRRLVIALLVVAALLVGAVCGSMAVTITRSSAYSKAAVGLQATWDKDQRDGVPVAGIKPLRAELDAKGPHGKWWSIEWLHSDGLAFIDELQHKTDSVWTAAMAGAQQRAQAAIDEWTAFVQKQDSWIAADAKLSARGWPAQLKAAATPAQLNALTAKWQTATKQQRQTVQAAQQAKLAEELAAAGGPDAVLATAKHLVGVADAVNLDDQGVATLAAQLQAELASGADATETAKQLLAAVNSLQAVVNLNDQVAAAVRPLMYAVDQALAVGTPNAGPLNSQYQAVQAAFAAARTGDQLNTVSAQIVALQTAVNNELSANQCGHPVGAGKVITVSLSLQEMVFYENGCVAQATPVSTGRPELRTPAGNFSIFYKTSPFRFISPWPPSSPYYYYPSNVSWVMEFAADGYFIHDAPWEAESDYGPGSEDNLAAASHGCIHVPTAVMGWAYSWTPMGTPVIIN